MEVKLDAYEGPLDLLLQLIRRHEIDIYDIPISLLTGQYIKAIANLPPDMGELSEFLVMAATLLEIKARMLLPRPPKADDDTETEDPRDALVQKLLAYKQAQAIAVELQKHFPVGERITNVGDREVIAQFRQSKQTEFETHITSTDQLLSIFAEVMQRRESKRDHVRANYGKMQRDRFTITEKVLHIQELLRSTGRVSLRGMFELCHSKSEMVVTFLALLELIRRGEITARQSASFADVLAEPVGVAS